MMSRDLSSVRQRTGRAGPVPTYEEASAEEASAYEYSPQEEQLRQYNRQRWVWGKPETVKGKLEELGRQFGVDEYVVVTICPDLESRLRSYELLAEAFALTPRSSTTAR
jgi:alkanesulfonate monooxygenase SsuD/methylene tetrahydromethanopterin reductase-like flavin-dependent oxidoreductase (luciferase family)